MTAKRRKPARGKASAPAKAMPSIPTRLADVAGWAEELRARRLNADGRAAIDLAQVALEQLLAAVEKAKSGPARVRLVGVGLPVVEKQLRVALQADRAEADHELVRMRRKLDDQQSREDALERLH